MNPATTNTTSPHVTLIISHKVEKEEQQEFARLQEELAQKLKSFEGFLGMESSVPEKELQNDWIIIYRFQNAPALSKWMDSPERLQVVGQIRALTGSEGSVQILAEQQHRVSVTTVFAHRIKKGYEEDYRKWRRKVLEAKRHFPGFLGIESFDPIQDVSDQWVDIAHFSDAKSRNIWMNSRERKSLVAELRHMAEDISVKSVSSGLDAWFRSGTEEDSATTPPVWKQAMAVWLGLYPTVMLLTYYFNPLLGPVSMPLLMLVGNAISVSLLSWVVMKWVNKLLNFWLMPSRKSLSLDIAGALLVLLALIGMYFIFQYIPAIPTR